jgi:hypothetical protein
MGRIAVINYSATGHLHHTGQGCRRGGARTSDAEVRLRRVPDYANPLTPATQPVGA